MEIGNSKILLIKDNLVEAKLTTVTLNLLLKKIVFNKVYK